MWRLELRKLSPWETHPSGGVINLGLLFDPTPVGILSSSFPDLLLIRLLVKTLMKAAIPLERLMLCMSMHTQKMDTQTPPLIMHLSHIQTLSVLLLCLQQKAVLMRHQGLRSCHIKWDWDKHTHTHTPYNHPTG